MDQLAWIAWKLHTIDRKLEYIMADQATLDAYVARIGVAVSAIKAEIDGLKAQAAAGTPLNFSALDTAVAGVEGLEPAGSTTGATGADAAVAPAGDTAPPAA